MHGKLVVRGWFKWYKDVRQGIFYKKYCTNSICNNTYIDIEKELYSSTWVPKSR